MTIYDTANDLLGGLGGAVHVRDGTVILSDETKLGTNSSTMRSFPPRT
jgi:hypothetical protein